MRMQLDFLEVGSLKVLIVDVDGFSIVRFRSALIRTLVKQGCEVLVASGSFHQEHRSALESLGARVTCFPLQRTGMNPIADLKTRSHIEGLVRESNPDVVLARAAKAIAYTLPAAYSLHVPCRIALLTGLGTMFRPTTLFERAAGTVGRRIIARGLRAASDVWVLNADDADTLRNSKLVPSETSIFELDADGVDLSHFEPTPLPVEPAFCFVGRLLPAKGVRTFIDAARKSRHAGSTARFIIAGEPDDHRGAVTHRELEHLVNEGVLEYRGFVQDLNALLAECTALVLPSYHEGRPRTVQEALACGRPVIVSDAVGCHDAIKNGREGIVLPVGDVDALCNTFEKLAQDKPLAEKMGIAARELAEQRYDENVIAQRAAERFLDT
jgi:glycosyltransferase involved in cell wall biosynthesis